jgi:ribosomal protein L29
MADVKKPAAKKAAPKKAESKSTAELLVEARADLLAAKKSHANGELVNPKVLGKYRKDIARLMTKLTAEKGAK